MITKCRECSVNVFMECLFHGKMDNLHGGNFDDIFTEYIDLSGVGKTKEYALLSAIHNTQTRITFIQTMVAVQREFFIHFSMPFVNAFDDFRKYGHRLTWNQAEPEKFFTQLKLVDTKEKKNVAELDKLMKEYADLQKDGVKQDADGRKDFVRQLNALNRAGYTIDRDKTDMETLALMILDYNEEVAAMNDAKNKKETK